MSRKELKIRLTNFWNDVKKIAEKEGRTLEDKDLQAYEELVKMLS